MHLITDALYSMWRQHSMPAVFGWVHTASWVNKTVIQPQTVLVRIVTISIFSVPCWLTKFKYSLGFVCKLMLLLKTDISREGGEERDFQLKGRITKGLLQKPWLSVNLLLKSQIRTCVTQTNKLVKPCLYWDSECSAVFVCEHWWSWHSDVDSLFRRRRMAARTANCKVQCSYVVHASLHLSDCVLHLTVYVFIATAYILTRTLISHPICYKVCVLFLLQPIPEEDPSFETLK